MTPLSFKLTPLKRLVKQHSGAIKAGPFGSDLTSHDMQGGPVRVYNQRNVIERDLTVGDSGITEEKFSQLRSFEVHTGDVLITTRGTIGRILVVPSGAQRGILHPCLIRVQPDERKLDTRYLAWVLQDDEFMQEQVKLLSKSSTIDVIYSETMASLRVPCPPKHVQTAIADYLDRKTAAIDALIEKKERLIEELRKYQEAVIAEAVAPREGWRAYKVKHLFRALPKSSLPSGAGADAGSVKFYVSGEETKRVAEAMHTGTALLLADGGKATMHLAEGEFAWSDHVVCLTSEDGVTTEFIYNQLSVQRDMLDALGFRGTGLPMLDKRWLYEDLPVLLPESCDEAKRINTVIRTVREIVHSLTAKAYAAGQELRSYRAALISEAVSGKLSLDKVSH